MDKLDDLPEKVVTNSYNCFKFDDDNKIYWKDINKYKRNDWVGSTVNNAFFTLLSNKHSSYDREIVKTSDFGDQLLWPNRTNTDDDKLFKRFLPTLHTKTVIFPVNIKNTHWCLIELDTEDSDILIYDSLDLKKRIIPEKAAGILREDGKKKRTRTK